MTEDVAASSGVPGGGGGGGDGNVSSVAPKLGQARQSIVSNVGGSMSVISASGHLSIDGSFAILPEGGGGDGLLHQARTPGTGGGGGGGGNLLPPSSAAAVLARCEKKAPSFCDTVRKFLRQYTNAMVAAQKARMEAQTAGKGGKKGGKKGAKKGAGGKKKKEPPVEFEPWSNFLEELNRKSTSGSLKVEDFPLYVSRLAPHELRGLHAACITVGKKTFPDNFDEKLAILRETVRMAAAGFMHRQPGGGGRVGWGGLNHS